MNEPGARAGQRDVTNCSSVASPQAHDLQVREREEDQVPISVEEVDNLDDRPARRPDVRDLA